MRNLNGCLKKILLICSSLSLFLLPIGAVHAQDDLSVKTEIYQSWQDKTLSTTIYYTFSVENTSKVISYYTTTILDENIKPEILLINKNKQLDSTNHTRKGATDIVINMNNIPVTKDSPVTIKLTYSQQFDGSKLTVTSQVSDTNTTKLELTYPKTQGKISWSSTPVSKFESKGNNYVATIDNPQGDKTTFTLGDDISYKFHISRNLINTSDEMYTSEIILPPNTPYQKVIIDSFTPQPNRSYQDTNGNYILQYELAADSNLTVDITGYIKMEKSLEIEDNNYNAESKEYWKISDDSEITRFNKYLKANGLDVSTDFSNISELKETPQKDLFYKLAYQYVVERLEPNTLTLGSLTGGVRLGATQTLQAQAEATAEDYSDALIGIYRAYGVPARFCLGYVTNISDYNPDGMYHTWLEFFDQNKKDWRIADPFLEDYSHVSLWNRDLPDHVVLIYRYEDPNTPKLPYFTENDFKIEKTDISTEFKYDMDASFSFKPYKLTDSHLQGSIIVKNTGNTILDYLNISKSNPDLNKYIDHIENSNSTILLPGDSTEVKFNIPSEDVEANIFAVINGYSGTSQTEEKYITSEFDIIGQDKYLTNLTKLISALLYVVLSIPAYLILKKTIKK